MKRHKHSLSHYRLVTGDMGKLIPVGMFEVLPGDSVQQSTSALLRVQPLLAPVMHPVTVRIHHWFVPYRLLWQGWEDFITGGEDGEGGDSGPFPTLNITSPTVGSLPDYFGIPASANNLEISALPIRAYNLIFNEFYRDQDLSNEVQENNLETQLCAWEKDYFTSARPWPQKGPEVTLPLGTRAPVVPIANTAPQFGGTSWGPAELRRDANSANASFNGANPASAEDAFWTRTALEADLSGATAVDVNTVRRAFAIQRYQEARARYGSRYTEYLRYLGVRSSDARLQRPEYLGGGKQTISFSEVLQTGPDTSDEGVANLKGHGITAMRSRRYRRFFEEHGVVLSLLSTRPKTIYVQATNRLWFRRTKEDFWQRELEQIGQQAIVNNEVYGGGGGGTFGYQDRYSEYKYIESSVHGEFRDILNYWHLGRSFTAAPALNDEFVKCDPTKRILAEQTQHSLLMMISNSIQARRMVSRSGSSRIM